MTGQYMKPKSFAIFMLILLCVYGQFKEHRDQFNEYIQELGNLPFTTIMKKIKKLNTKIQSDQNTKFENQEGWYDNNWTLFQKYYPLTNKQISNEECILTKIIKNDDFGQTISELSENEKMKLLFDWSVWILHFYMAENGSRGWLFDQMRSLQTSNDGGWLKYYENTNENALDTLTKEELYAQLTMYVTTNIMQSINIYRQCNPTLPVHTELKETEVGPYIYRGIRVADFDLEKSTFPTNFQSFSMSMYPGVRTVLHWYENEHIQTNQFTTIVVMGNARKLIQQTAQPIQLFNGFLKYNTFSRIHGAPSQEQEVLFPPFCIFDLKKLELSDLNTDYHQEIIISQLWHLNSFEDYRDQIEFSQDLQLNVLWITKVDCLIQFDEVSGPVQSTTSPELEQTERFQKENLFQFPENENRKTNQTISMYGRIVEFHSQFPTNNLPLYPCVRLFATHYEDITFTGTISTKEDLQNIIIELKESAIKMYFDSNSEIINVELKSNKHHPWGFEVDENTWEVTDVIPEEQAHQLGIQRGWKIIKMNFKSINDRARRNIVFTEKQPTCFTFQKPIDKSQQKSIQEIVDEIWNDRASWENKPYQILYIKIFYLSYHTVLPSKESCRFCMQWLEKMYNNKNYEDFSVIPICELATAQDDEENNRFVCEFSDGTYSPDVFFPCQRTKFSKNRTIKEYGIFCRVKSA